MIPTQVSTTNHRSEPTNDNGQVQLTVVVDGDRKLSVTTNPDQKPLAASVHDTAGRTRGGHRRLLFGGQIPWSEIGVVRQRLVAIRERLSDRAAGWMTKARSFRAGVGSGGRTDGSRALPQRAQRVLEAVKNKCCSTGDTRGLVGEVWTKEMAVLREDIRRINFWRAVVGEFVGSLFLVLIGCGASVQTDHPEQPVTVRVALAFGVTYTAGLYCLHSGNDGHLNTAVTVAMAVTRRVSVARCLLYIGTQILGAIAGASALYWVTAEEYKGDLGCTRLSRKVSEGQGFLVEFFSTLILVFVVFSSYDDRNKDKNSVAPFIIGLTLMSVSLFSIPYTGGSMNTARSFGPALVQNSWSDHWIYWFGPILGGAAGGALHDLLFSAGSSFRRIRQCLLRFQRRRAAAKGVHGQSDDQRRRSQPEVTLQRSARTSIALSEKARTDFEETRKTWEVSRDEEEEEEEEEEEDEEEDDDEEEDEDEEDEEEEVEGEKKSAAQGHTGFVNVSEAEGSEPEVTFIRRSSSYLKSLALVESQTEVERFNQVPSHSLAAAAAVEPTPTTSKGGATRSTTDGRTTKGKHPKGGHKLGGVVIDVTDNDPTQVLVMKDGHYDNYDDDDDDYSVLGETIVSDDTSDSLDDV